MENNKKIVLVEDEESLGFIYKTKLEVDGFQVELTTNGVDALEAIRRVKPDLVLLDVIIPQLDGFAVLTELKADADLKSIPVIMLTNLGTEEDRQKGESLGAADYLVKASLTPAQLADNIKKLLQLS